MHLINYLLRYTTRQQTPPVWKHKTNTNKHTSSDNFDGQKWRKYDLLPKILFIEYFSAENIVRRKMFSAENVVRRNILSAEIQKYPVPSKHVKIISNSCYNMKRIKNFGRQNFWILVRWKFSQPKIWSVENFVRRHSISPKFCPIRKTKNQTWVYIPQCNGLLRPGVRVVSAASFPASRHIHTYTHSTLRTRRGQRWR